MTAAPLYPSLLELDPTSECDINTLKTHTRTHIHTSLAIVVLSLTSTQFYTNCLLSS